MPCRDGPLSQVIIHNQDQHQHQQHHQYQDQHSTLISTSKLQHHHQDQDQHKCQSCRDVPDLKTPSTLRGLCDDSVMFFNEVKHLLFEQTIFYVTLILLFCQNPQPRRLQDPCERLEGGQDGVAHEDVGLRLHALEGGHRGHLRLQEAPQRMRTPQLSDPLQSEHQIILTQKFFQTMFYRCVNSTGLTSMQKELTGES